MGPRRSSRLQSQPAAPCVLPGRGRPPVTPGKPSDVPLNSVLEVVLLALGDSTLALQVAVMTSQASRANRATVSCWRQSIGRFHLDFGSRELKLGSRTSSASGARQAFVLRQMWRCWAPHATAITLVPRFRHVEKQPLSAHLSGLLQLWLSEDGATVRSVNDPAMVASSGCSVTGPLMTTNSGTYTLRLRFDVLHHHHAGYVSLGMAAANSRLVMRPGHAPDQVAWIYRFEKSSVVACFEERVVHSLVIRGAQIRPPAIGAGDELSLCYDTARRTLTCRNLTRGEITHPLAIIPRKGIPYSTPLCFALGGTNGFAATLLGFEVHPPAATPASSTASSAASSSSAPKPPLRRAVGKRGRPIES